MRNILPFVCLLATASIAGNAQVMELPAVIKAPIHINPAMTGLIPGDVRIVGNYYGHKDAEAPRQWKSADLSADMRVLKKLLPKRDALGVGITYQYGTDRNTFFDYTGTYNLAGLAVAYHKSLSKSGRHHLSVGLHLKSVTTEITQSPSSPEANIKPYRNYDIGAVYSGQVGKAVSLYGGYAITRFIKTDILYVTQQQEYPMNITSGNSVFAGGSVIVGSATSVHAHILVLNEHFRHDVQASGYARFVLNKQKGDSKKPDFALTGGTLLLYKNKVMPNVGVEWAGVRLGLARGIKSENGSNRWLLSVAYTGDGKTKPEKGTWNCPAIF